MLRLSKASPSPNCSFHFGNISVFYCGKRRNTQTVHVEALSLCNSQFLGERLTNLKNQDCQLGLTQVRTRKAVRVRRERLPRATSFCISGSSVMGSRHMRAVTFLGTIFSFLEHYYLSAMRSLLPGTSKNEASLLGKAVPLVNLNFKTLLKKKTMRC